MAQCHMNFDTRLCNSHNENERKAQSNWRTPASSALSLQYMFLDSVFPIVTVTSFAFSNLFRFACRNTICVGNKDPRDLIIPKTDYVHLPDEHLPDELSFSHNLQ